MSDSGWNMYVFRDGRKNVRGLQLVEELRRWVEQMSMSSEDVCLGALIAAGELECALADVNAEDSGRAASITDDLAHDLIGGPKADRQQLLQTLSSIRAPETVSIAVAEGFAYYALHPLRFVEPIRQLASDAPVRVVGLRSIGTTLSAVVRALLTANGSPAERITVRPTGHPYDRKIELSMVEKAWLHEGGYDATVVVVDEGPGLSGSSFLSVAEAIEMAGIAQHRIVMLGSRYPDITQLRAPNAMQRWERYNFFTASPAPILPPDAQVDLTGGNWRHHFWEDFDHQPAAWTQLELAKYMTSDRSTIFKFHGYGHFAEAIAGRARAAAERGFSPRCSGVVCGFGKYRVERGRLLTIEDLTPDLLECAAEYCAFRSREMSTLAEGTSSELETMAKWNWLSEFGSELGALSLVTERPVIADGRMLPHEWMRMENGRILKLDGSTHGDDHFFPGPCDVAWDLAGMIVEWELNEVQAAEFLDAYRRISNDDAQSRVGDYLLVYATFRMAWSKMAARASEGMFDEKLLLRDYVKYRRQVLDFNSRSQPRAVPERSVPRGLNPTVAF